MPTYAGGLTSQTEVLLIRHLCNTERAPAHTIKISPLQPIYHRTTKEKNTVPDIILYVYLIYFSVEICSSTSENKCGEILSHRIK